MSHTPGGRGSPQRYCTPIRRLFEQLAWRQLTAWAEARGLTRWPAEQWAAQQLGRPVRTFQTRLPVAGKNPEATVHVTRTVECLA